MKKVIHILASNKFSGAENVVCGIIDMFRNSEYEMIYCCPNGDIKEVLDKKNIPYILLNKMSYREVKKAVYKYNPDIIHAHDVRASILASLINKKYKVISHMHVNNNDMKSINMKSILYYISTFCFSKIIWVSKSAYDKYIFSKFIKDKSDVIYNIVNIEEIKERVHKDKNTYNYNICFIGRLCEQKDPIRLINIIKDIKVYIPNIKCVIIGEGYLKDKIENIIKINNLEENIDILGFVSNPLKILNDSKLLLMTSKFEGTPMCALEAMVLGIPIVSTPTDGLIQLVDDNITGYLCDKNEEIVEKVIKILNNDDLQKYLSKNAKSKSIKINKINEYRCRIANNYQ